MADGKWSPRRDAFRSVGGGGEGGKERDSCLGAVKKITSLSRIFSVKSKLVVLDKIAEKKAARRWTEAKMRAELQEEAVLVKNSAREQRRQRPLG